MKWIKGGWMVLGFSALLSGMSGCNSVALNVVKFPSFFESTGSYQTLAIAPTTNGIEGNQFVWEASNIIVNDLYNSNTYSIYNHSHDHIDGNSLYSAVKDSGEAELILYSSITDYGINEDERYETRTQERPVFAKDERGRPLRDDNGEPIVEYYETHEVPYRIFTRTGYASIGIDVIRTSDDQVVYSDVMSDSCESEDENPHYLDTPPQLISCAIQGAAHEVSEPLTIHRTTIHTTKDKLMKIYRFTENGWTDSEDFTVSDETIMVTLSFPESANFNSFGLDVVVKGENQPIVSYDFTWDKNNPYIEYQIPIAELVANSHGSKKFNLRVLNDGTVAMEKTVVINH